MLKRKLHKQTTNFIITNNKLNPPESGFRTGYSTQTAVFRLCQDVRYAVDQGQLTILVLFDFRKAFDTVMHSRLLIKLRRLGFSDAPLRWVFSYLTGVSDFGWGGGLVL